MVSVIGVPSMGPSASMGAAVSTSGIRRIAIALIRSMKENSVSSVSIFKIAYIFKNYGSRFWLSESSMHIDESSVFISYTKCCFVDESFRNTGLSSFICWLCHIS